MNGIKLLNFRLIIIFSFGFMTLCRDSKANIYITALKVKINTFAKKIMQVLFSNSIHLTVD